MIFLKSLILKHFRNHEDSVVSLAPGINIIHGRNGAGKTNILEAIHYLCLGQSFLSSSDRFAVREGSPFFDLTATFIDPDGATTLRMTCVPGEGKRFFVNGAPLERLADILGRFPCVVHSHDDHALTAGPPEERRRFVDSALCQFRPVYTDNLIRFKRTLKQRNAALQAVRFRGAAASTLDSWNHELVVRGAAVASARLAFSQEFERYLRDAYERLAVVKETPSLTYRPAGVHEVETDDEFAEAYAARIADVRMQEIDSARTLVGPHRDEFRLALDGRELRRFASQGQHRTFGMALKIAEHRYLSERCEHAPILLLDDAFTHLDFERQRAFADLFAEPDFGQTIMTAATFEPIAALVRDRAGSDVGLIEVSEGRVVSRASPQQPTPSQAQPQLRPLQHPQPVPQLIGETN
jgi:DNA replication and repair protein RecF